jgi:hypothetical protein
MTQEEKKELMAGLFQGANLEHAQINVVVEKGAKVVYKEITDRNHVELDEEQEEIIDKLKPIFFGVEEEAKAFFLDIQGMKATQITAKVNQLVIEKKISGMSHHRELWQILHECGLYDKSESNWNQRLK